MKRAALLLLFATTLSATPFHEAPKAWTATINGPDAQNEQYGPFVSKSDAARFCARIPKMYTCKATPILPPGEWLRKGAR